MSDDSRQEGIIHSGGETYLSIERAADYLGRGRASMFGYIKRYNLQKFLFPLEGKRIFLRQSDLDALRNGHPAPMDPKAEPAIAA